MNEWIEERERSLREFFGLRAGTEMIPRGSAEGFEMPGQVSAHLARFNIEWHVIPTEESVSADTDDYRARLYPLGRKLKRHEYQHLSHFRALTHGHRRHQGRIIGVEATRKPRYLPGNQQFYGTPYGFEADADPFAPYMGRAGFVSGTRYGHNYPAMRRFVAAVTEDWRARGLMPRGFRVTICPPVVFNLVGAVFHPEWSETESLELGFYRDEEGSAHCYAVGSNAPGDFSFIRGIEADSDWTLLGFRVALVPE